MHGLFVPFISNFPFFFPLAKPQTVFFRLLNVAEQEFFFRL